jgi:RNA polymerase sigma-70 factor (ECF subfamily)
LPANELVEPRLRGGVEHGLAGLLRAAVAGDEGAYRDFLRRAAYLVRDYARRKSAQYGCLRST